MINRFLYFISSRIEQFETLFQSDLIDLKKLKILAFNGTFSQGHHRYENLFFLYQVVQQRVAFVV